MNAKILLVVSFVSSCLSSAFATDRLALPFQDGECWWGGVVMEGHRQPLSAASESNVVDMRLRHGRYGGNQAAPLLLSSCGRWIWCEQAFAFSVTNGALVVESEKSAPILTGETKEGTLRAAYRHCSATFFPPKGHPALKFFEAPILNTWIELQYNQNEKDVLAYGESFVSNGIPPGVYMIDHTWHREPFGCWDFHDGRFHDPKGMVAKLNGMGYTMMLWIDPHVSTDTAVYRQLAKDGLLLKSAAGEGGVAESTWWAGKSAILDCTNPKAYAWLKGACDRLMRDYGVEGFFFDGGDAFNYPPTARPFVVGASPSDQVFAYHRMGLEMPYQQHRASWKMGGLPLMQTLRDKNPTYKALRQCVSHGLLASLLGYPFVVFDLVGGGQVDSFESADYKFAQTYFIRSLQTQCLSPMVQFSLSPWKVLDAQHQQLVRDLIALRQKWMPYIVACVKDCGKTGEPIMRSLEYAYPGHGWERVDDEFLMGDRLLVAPQVDEGDSRTVVIPPGRWKADDGQVYEGPKSITISVPLARLPYFEKL